MAQFVALIRANPAFFRVRRPLRVAVSASFAAHVRGCFSPAIGSSSLFLSRRHGNARNPWEQPAQYRDTHPAVGYFHCLTLYTPPCTGIVHLPSGRSALNIGFSLLLPYENQGFAKTFDHRVQYYQNVYVFAEFHWVSLTSLCMFNSLHNASQFFLPRFCVAARPAATAVPQ